MASLRLREIRPSSISRARLKEILKAAQNKRVLVIGDVGVDRYTFGAVERISPEAPVPIVRVEREQLKLGLAANVADNLKALGGVPLLVGVIGRDRGAQDFRKLLRREKIIASHLIVDRLRRTVLKERIVSDRQQLLRVDYETPEGLSRVTEAACRARVKKLLSSSDAVILQDYAKGLLNPKFSRELISLVRKSGRVLAADPNAKTPIGAYRGAWVLTPNTREAERLSGIPIRDESSLLRAGAKLLAEARAEHVVVTRGKDGMAIFSRKSRDVQLIPTYAREVYDVSGAGDTVISVLALALVAGGSIVEAAVLGNLAAGVEVGKRGTATVSPDEILTALETFKDFV